MYLHWGSKSWGPGKVGVVLDQQGVLNPRNQIVAHDVQISMSFLLTSQKSTLAALTADITSQTEEVQSAFMTGGKDLFYRHLDGSNSHIRLTNAQCLGGTRIVNPPSFPDSKGVEHVTKRTVTVTVGGRVPLADADQPSMVFHFREELKFSPAGRKTGHIETAQTKAVKQTLRQHQTYRAEQSGTIVGLYDYPDIMTFAPPTWPFALVDDEPTYSLGEPETVGEGGLWKFPVSYTWLYESSTRLTGRPRTWTF